MLFRRSRRLRDQKHPETYSNGCRYQTFTFSNGMTILISISRIQDSKALYVKNFTSTDRSLGQNFRGMERNWHFRSIRGGFHNSLATLPATRKMHAAWSSDWMMKPRRAEGRGGGLFFGGPGLLRPTRPR